MIRERLSLNMQRRSTQAPSGSSQSSLLLSSLSKRSSSKRRSSNFFSQSSNRLIALEKAFAYVEAPFLVCPFNEHQKEISSCPALFS